MCELEERLGTSGNLGLSGICYPICFGGVVLRRGIFKTRSVFAATCRSGLISGLIG